MGSFTGSGGAAFSSERDDWETPPEVFRRCDEIWHFDLDAASSDGNALCERHFTKADDGLSQDWSGRRVWCNPPCGREIGKWVRKAYESASGGGCIVVMLLPARTDTAWFHEYCAKADEVALLRGRLRFRINGEQMQSAPFPSMLVRFGGSLSERSGR